MTKADLERRIAGVEDEIAVQAAEIFTDSVELGPRTSNALEFGGLFPAFLHLYARQSLYDKIKISPYEEFRRALHSADAEVMPAAAEHLAKQGIRTIFSLGPTPEADARLLELLVKEKIPITYRAIDIHPAVLRKAISDIASRLDAKFDDWREYIKLKDELSSFQAVKSQESSMVILTGGTVSNHPYALWQTAARLAGPGGLIMADSGITPEHPKEQAGYWKEYWMSMYNTKAQRNLLCRGLEQFCPDLFRPENRSKWQLTVHYVTSIDNRNWRERSAVPLIRVGLRITGNIDIKWANLDYQLRKGQEIIPIVSAKPGPVNFMVNAGVAVNDNPRYSLMPLWFAEKPIDYAIGNGEKGNALAILFDVRNLFGRP